MLKNLSEKLARYENREKLLNQIVNKKMFGEDNE